MNGLAQIYSSWITRFKVDGFRVDTAKHVNAAFFKLWVPKIRAAARVGRRQGLPGLRRGDPERRRRPVGVRARPRAAAGARLPVPAGRRRLRVRRVRRARASANRLDDDDYFRTANGVDPAFTTFLGNHDMGRAAQQILHAGAGPVAGRARAARAARLRPALPAARRAGGPLRRRGRDDRLRRRQGRAAGHVPDAGVATGRPRQRVGSPPIGKGSSFDVTTNPIEAQLNALAALRDAHPELATGASVVRYATERRARRLAHRPRESPRGGRRRFNNGATPRDRHGADGARTNASWTHRVRLRDSVRGNLTLTIPPGLGASSPCRARRSRGRAAVEAGADRRRRQPHLVLPPERGPHGCRACERRVRDPPARRGLAARRDRRLGALPRVPRAGPLQEAGTGGRRRGRQRGSTARWPSRRSGRSRRTPERFR